MHVFLTGERNIGKTTLIDKILDELPENHKIGGFRTFKSTDFAPGKNYILMTSAGKDTGNKNVIQDELRVALRDKTNSGYETYPEVFDHGGMEILDQPGKSDLILMDELGFMESKAHKFQEKVLGILDGDIPVLGAIKPDANHFLDKVRNHPKVKVIEVTEYNRNELLDELFGLFVPILFVKDLSFIYDDSDIPAISSIDLEIGLRSVNVILGPSGCGKSTLCRCLTGIIPNAYEGDLSGDILFRGSSIKDEKLSHIATKIGLVMQEPDNQIVASTVEDDIAFGPENMMISPDEIRAVVDNQIDYMELGGLQLRSPTSLSGGEKQRTVIAGIGALDPEVLVFDEPMSSLDEKNKQNFIDAVKILSNRGKTIIIVEHDFYRLDFADNWIIMKDGTKVTEGKPAYIDKKLLEVDLWR